MSSSLEQNTIPNHEVTPAGSQVSRQLEVNGVAMLIGRYLYRYSNEVQLQDRMHEVLEAEGYSVERERILDARNRTDLWLSGIVVEVKVDGSFASALRQVSRYMSHPEVRGVVLASTERWAEKPLTNRPDWGGKPFSMIRVRRQSL